MLEDELRSETNESLKMKKKSAPLLSTSLLFLYLISLISQDLNLISGEQLHFVSATIAHHHFSSNSNNNSTNPIIANLNIINNNNNNQTTNSQEFLLNLVKNSYKTGANANSNSNNNATSQSHTSASSSAASSMSSAQSPASIRPPLPSRPAQPMHYQTTYACEGNQLEFGCQEGKMIHLVRAIYGRFSLSICNEQGFSNYSVDCASFKAFLLMETR